MQLLAQISGSNKTQHTYHEDQQTTRQGARQRAPFMKSKVESLSLVTTAGDRILERRYPVIRGVFETAKQLLGSWSSGGRFTPTHSYQPPQCVRETQNICISWLPWTPPFQYSDYHCEGTEVMEWLETGQNLVPDERGVIGTSATGSPRR